MSLPGRPALRVLFGVVVLVAACAACSGPQGPSGGEGPRAKSASLQGAVARAGDLDVPAAEVAAVARAQGVAPRSALDALIEDALAAQGASARGLDRAPPAAWEATSVLARAVPARLAEGAAGEGPPTPVELSDVEVVHALVGRAPTLREEDAVAIAEAIRRAVRGSRTGDEFQARARAVPHPQARVIVQPVPPFGADGLDASGSQSFDPGFVAASFALRAPLDVSPVVASPFGWHVIMLVRRGEPRPRTPELAADLEKRVVELRARIALDAVLAARRASTKAEVLSGADALMERAAGAP